MIACYAPTDDAEEEIKNEFYEQLEEEIRTTHRHDVLIVVDLNARVGEDNTERKWVIATQGFGCINNNGERRFDLYVETNLVIGETLFKNRTIHKTTWRSPDGNTVSQIDHEIINQKWRRSLQVVRARREADVGSDLVVTTLSLNLRKAKGGEATAILHRKVEEHQHKESYSTWSDGNKQDSFRLPEKTQRRVD